MRFTTDPGVGRYARALEGASIRSPGGYQVVARWLEKAENKSANLMLECP